MVECPVCFGSGEHDFRDSDAYLSEHWTDAEIAVARANGLQHPMGIIDCDVCDSTGLVTEDEYRDIMAANAATADQTLAKLRDQGLID
jgi:hypothetical protein